MIKVKEGIEIDADRLLLFVDNNELSKVSIERKPLGYMINTFSSEVNEQLTSFSIENYSEEIGEIILRNWQNWGKVKVDIDLLIYHENKTMKAVFMIDEDDQKKYSSAHRRSYNKPSELNNKGENLYSFAELKDEFLYNLYSLKREKKIEHFSLSGDNNPTRYVDRFSIFVTIPLKFSDRPISEEVTLFGKILYNVYEVTVSNLESNRFEKSFLAFFNFPKDLKVSCEQYLLYFAQFLQDLGINATSNLKEEAGKVLFSVTPTDDVEALDKIREALAVYLNLPASPIVYDESFAAMRLQQQIENLQHAQRMAVRELQFNEKLLTAQAEVLHEKNITISQQKSVIENQQKIIEKIIDPAVMMNSAEKKEELEEIYDGIKVGESESLKKWLGISLNPAKAIKTAVKNTLGKEDGKKSVLGLDEES